MNDIWGANRRFIELHLSFTARQQRMKAEREAQRLEDDERDRLAQATQAVEGWYSHKIGCDEYAIFHGATDVEVFPLTNGFGVPIPSSVPIVADAVTDSPTPGEHCGSCCRTAWGTIRLNHKAIDDAAFDAAVADAFTDYLEKEES